MPGKQREPITDFARAIDHARRNIDPDAVEQVMQPIRRQRNWPEIILRYALLGSLAALIIWQIWKAA